MYMAERRQSNSTRLFGLIGTAAAIAAVGVVLVSMRETVVVPFAPPAVMVALPSPEPVVDDPIKPLPLDDLNIPQKTIILRPIDDFTWDKETPHAPPVDYGDKVVTPTEVIPSSTPGPAVIPATRPVLIAGDKPEYPPAAERARESGTTTLSLCISKAGRVTQASVANSSGSARLDQAALSWIRHERFKPGTENGQPADMCNHTLSYVWNLPRR